MSIVEVGGSAPAILLRRPDSLAECEAAVGSSATPQPLTRPQRSSQGRLD